jgi:hypothetical protein
MHRREALQVLAITAGARSLVGLDADHLIALGARVHAAEAPQERRVLDAQAMRTVVMAAERIIPASETPGATDAGVAEFIDRLLAGWFTTEERDAFLAGLRALDDRAQGLHGKAFAECDAAAQTALLTTIDEEVNALRRQRGADVANAHWFAMLKYTTVFGYFTSEAAMRRTLRAWPRPLRYNGCAPVTPGGS